MAEAISSGVAGRSAGASAVDQDVDVPAAELGGSAGQRPHRVGTLPGLRAWRDLLVEHQRSLECRGGCPIGTLGAEVAEIDDAARMAVARGVRPLGGQD